MTIHKRETGGPTPAVLVALVALVAVAAGLATPALATTCAEFTAMGADERNTTVAELEPPPGEPRAPDEAGALESRVASLLQLCEPTPEADIERVLSEVGR